MRITQVTLRVGERASGAAAFAALLDLPLEEDLAGPFVRIGWTVVRPVTSSGDGVDHIAILVPGDAYRAAAAWLLARTPPLEVDVAGPAGWASTSVYVDGPGGSVLELIAHHGHRTASDAAFPTALLGVCEVGIAVPDVPGVVEASGMPVFAGTRSPDFAAIGDIDGKLILATPGRVWFPTEDRVAGLAPVVIGAVDGAPIDLGIGAASFAVR